MGVAAAIAHLAAYVLCGSRVSGQIAFQSIEFAVIALKTPLHTKGYALWAKQILHIRHVRQDVVGVRVCVCV